MWLVSDLVKHRTTKIRMNELKRIVSYGCRVGEKGS